MFNDKFLAVLVTYLWIIR